jgi:superfamily II DNA or RNA helicase
VTPVVACELQVVRGKPMFDFGKLKRPATGTKPINPIEIFRSAPALQDSPNDLWQGQSRALETWHENRRQKDVLISLHTGAGKTIVGLLIAQSLVHEGANRVLYVCATNDLINQTSIEVTRRLGFQHTTRMGGKFFKSVVRDRPRFLPYELSGLV